MHFMYLFRTSNVFFRSLYEFHEQKFRRNDAYWVFAHLGHVYKLSMNDE